MLLLLRTRGRFPVYILSRLTVACTSSSRDSNTLLWPLQAPAHTWYTSRYAGKHIYINKTVSKSFKKLFCENVGSFVLQMKQTMSAVEINRRLGNKMFKTDFTPVSWTLRINFPCVLCNVFIFAYLDPINIYL